MAVTAHAALIAEKLQGAHERRTGRREDTRMSAPEEQGASVWDDDPYVYAMNLVAMAGKVLGDITTSGHAPAAPQASAVSAERVVELERQLAEANEKLTAYSGQIRELEREQRELFVNTAGITLQRDELERQLAELQSLRHGLERKLLDAHQRAERAESEMNAMSQWLHGSYVAREVPWTDVAAGMMTIARDGTAWMVEQVLDADVPVAFRLRNGEKTFTKTPNDLGETVRVLVPYVTPEQAQALVASELGGRA